MQRKYNLTIGIVCRFLNLCTDKLKWFYPDKKREVTTHHTHNVLWSNQKTDHTQCHLNQSEDWSQTMSFKPIRRLITHNVLWSNEKTEYLVYCWRWAQNMLSRICWSIRHHFNCSADTLIMIYVDSHRKLDIISGPAS